MVAGRSVAAGLALFSLSACAALPQAAPLPAPTLLTDAEARAAIGAPPPTPTSDERAVIARVRELDGEDRWRLATAQAELGPAYAAQQFDCALGVRFAARDRPALVDALTRLATDTQTVPRRLAEAAPRARPAALDPTLRPCVRLKPEDLAGPSWPSVPAAVGAAYGELFAALAPDRAMAARETARQIGLSRVVCGLAWPSDVEAGARLGRAAYARLSADPAFQTVMQRARVEVAAARAEGLTNPGCAAERRAYETFDMPEADTQAGRGEASAP